MYYYRPLLHAHVPDLYCKVDKRILFLKPLFTFMDTFLPLITLAKDPMTLLSFTAPSLLLFLPSRSPCLLNTVPRYLNYAVIKKFSVYGS